MGLPRSAVARPLAAALLAASAPAAEHTVLSTILATALLGQVPCRDGGNPEACGPDRVGLLVKQGATKAEFRLIDGTETQIKLAGLSKGLRIRVTIQPSGKILVSIGEDGFSREVSHGGSFRVDPSKDLGPVFRGDSNLTFEVL